MFGFDLFGRKRRRLAREAELQATRDRLRERTAPVSRAQQAALDSTRGRSSHSSPPILVAHDPLHPLNPLNPLSPFGTLSQSDAYAAPRHDPEPVRASCSSSASDDSWSRSSSSGGSDYGCSSSSSSSDSSSSDSSSW